MNKLVLVALFLLTVSYVHARKQNKKDKKEKNEDCSVPNCAKCGKNDTCIRCVNGTHALLSKSQSQDGKRGFSISCVDECPEGTEPRDKKRRGSVCVKTNCNVPNCAMCSKKDTCIRCTNETFAVPSLLEKPNGRPIRNVSCVDACPEETKPFQKPWGGSVCLRTDCAPNCAACKNDKCIKCEDGSFTVINGRRSRNVTCEDECPEGTKEIECPDGDTFCVKTDKSGSRFLKMMKLKLCRSGPPKKARGGSGKKPSRGGKGGKRQGGKNQGGKKRRV